MYTGSRVDFRLKRLAGEGKSLFREFVLPAPYKSTKDVFALRDSRTVNPYRKISFNKLNFLYPEPLQGRK